MRVGLFMGGAAALAAALVLAPASDAAPKRATKQQLAVIDARQVQMKQLGGAMKTLAAYVKGDGADLAQAGAAAALVSRAGATMPHLFPAGTAVGVGDSSTRASLWKERDQFAARVAQFQTAAAGLNAATARGDRAEVGQRLGAVGASCKSCHEKWQVKD
jgi:cytochrome c556